MQAGGPRERLHALTLAFMRLYVARRTITRCS
jgi:hypothetical protein